MGTISFVRISDLTHVLLFENIFSTLSRWSYTIEFSAYEKNSELVMSSSLSWRCIIKQRNVWMQFARIYLKVIIVSSVQSLFGREHSVMPRRASSSAFSRDVIIQRHTDASGIFLRESKAGRTYHDVPLTSGQTRKDHSRRAPDHLLTNGSKTEASSAFI